MKVLIQRTKAASVTIDHKKVGHITHGLVLLIGIEKHDDLSSLKKMADKVIAYRVFSDQDDKMNLNVVEVGGGILAISQFTLAADTRKGLRPSFSAAASPEHALALYQQFIDMLRERHPTVETGIFAADMQVALINDGPVTFTLTI